MATLESVEAHRESVADVTAVAFADLVATWGTMLTAEVAELVQRLLDFLPGLFGDYGSMVGSVSADWYDDLRDEAGLPSGFRATPVDVSSFQDALEPLVRWSVEPLLGADPEPDAALSRLAGGAQKLLAGVDRGTVAQSAAADPGKPIYARHASANACTFCRLLATRDAVYGSEESALTVVGTRGARQIQALGDRYHSSCHCVAVPLWPGQEFERAPYVDEWQAAYLNAREETRSGDPSKILAHMRKAMGSR